MDNRIPAILFGAFLLVVGGLMLAAQRRGARRLLESAAGEGERRFLSLRIRRRSQVAGMIMLVGIMIPVGDALIPGEAWKHRPATFAIYWLIVMGLALWTIVLAVGDMVSTQTHVAMELHQLQRHRAELEHAARRLQQERDQEREDR